MIHCTSYSVANFFEFIGKYAKIFEMIQLYKISQFFLNDPLNMKVTKLENTVKFHKNQKNFVKSKNGIWQH